MMPRKETGMARLFTRMQHGNGDNEGQVEPVGHVDVRLLALEQRAKEDQQIRDPDDCDPEIDAPFRFGIFTPWVMPRR